jgi:predicted MPP superfamily phosphohydrolase
MSKFFMFLATVSTLFILSQWYVFASVRQYLFGRYKPVSRRVAYSVLAILGVANFVAVQLALHPTAGTGIAGGKEWGAIAFFTYLGAVLLLCLFFLLIGGAAKAFDLVGAVVTWVGSFKKSAESVGSSQKGCVSAGCKMPSTEFPEGTTETALPGCKAVAEAHCMEALPDPQSRCESVEGASSDPTRRTFLKWSAAAGIVAVSGLAAGGLAEAYQSATVEEFDVLHPALNGLTKPLTLIQITDFHFGMFFGNEELERLVNHVNTLEGDALVITGDIFHSPATPVESATPILKKLRPRPLGNYAILGNHDFYAGEWRSVPAIRESGIKLLRNQWITFDGGNTAVHLGGIDDPRVNWVWGAEFPEFRSFVNKAPHSAGLRILLSHRPNILPLAARAGMDFVLSGHIHGGQIIVPVPGRHRGLSLARIASDYTRGWYRLGSTRMYLNRGVGLTFIPWRLNCPPEISVFHLKPTEAGKSGISRTRSNASSNEEIVRKTSL